MMKQVFELLALLLPAVAVAGQTTPTPTPTSTVQPAAFTAHYELLRKGKPLGTSVMQLRRADDSWLFTTDAKATHGLAGLFGVTITEATHFRMHDGKPEVLDYHYHLDAGPKDDRRNVQVDWRSGRTTVTRGSDSWQYAAQPGMVDKHMLPWVLGRKLHGATHGKLEQLVATRKSVKTQHYLLEGKQSIDVPIGTLDAVRMDRNDPDRHFTAWYVPERYPIPVQLTHDDFNLRLERFSTP